MAELSADQRRELEALREAYHAELPEKLASVARAAAACLENYPSGMRELHQLVHRLAGSAAIWGFAAVSRAAGALEEVVLAAMEGTPPDGGALSGAVPRLVDELRRAAP